MGTFAQQRRIEDFHTTKRNKIEEFYNRER
jgi:hypothetical protein